MSYLANAILYRASPRSALARSPLAVALLVGLVLRVIWLWLYHDAPLWLDEPEYLQIARDIRSGSYGDNGLWVRPPLYPLWLALTLGPQESILLARICQMLLGLLLIYLLHRIALRLWDDQRIAGLCALLAAIYFPLIAYSGHLMAEMPLLVLLCCLLLSLLKLSRQPSSRGAASAGALLALAALTKPIALFCAPALLLACWAGGGSRRERVRRALLALGCGALLIAPWTLRNSLTYERFVLLGLTGGYNLWFGNRPAGGDELFYQQTLRLGGPAEQDRAFSQRARVNFLNDPAYGLGLIGAKLLRFWRSEIDVVATQHYGELALSCDAPSEINTVAARERQRCSPPLLLANLSSDLVYLPLLLGAAAGLLWLWRDSFVPLGLAWLLPIYLAAALTVVQSRMRLPLLPLLLPWASAGLLQLWSRLRQGLPRGRRLAATTLLLLAGAWGVKLLPLAGSAILQALAGQAWAAGQPERALARYESAILLYPSRITPLVAAGELAELLGQDERALGHYRAAIAVVDYQEQAHIGIARILQRRGDAQAARLELGRAAARPALLQSLSYASPFLPPQRLLDFGEQEQYGYVLGLYPSDSPQSWPSFRWTSPLTELRFGSMPTPASTLTLRVNGSRPTGAPAPHMEVFVNEVSIAAIAVQPGWQVYRFVVPPASSGLRLRLQATPFVPADYQQGPDERELGVALDWASIVPLASGVGF